MYAVLLVGAVRAAEHDQVVACRASSKLLHYLEAPQPANRIAMLLAEVTAAGCAPQSVTLWLSWEAGRCPLLSSSSTRQLLVSIATRPAVSVP